jgi:hypothetical protein
VSFSLVASIAACDATEDTYFIDGTTVYCHELGGESPLVALIENTKHALTANLAVDQSVYFENVDIIGGLSAIGSGNIYARDCIFEYGLYDSAVSVTCENSIFQDCRASRSPKDGFYYGNGVQAIELRCAGMLNGDGTSDTSNGSTTHSGAAIIRINGEYSYNHGPNVADVQDGTESWNLGCYAHHSTATSGTQNVDFQSSGEAGSAQSFLDTCVGNNSTYAARCLDAGGHIYIKQGEFYLVYTDNGLVSEY